DYSASIDWGDGSFSSGAITQNAFTNVFTVTGSHSYAEEGTPTITVTIHHDSADDSTATSSGLIRLISDIAGRSLTTGQWQVSVSNGSNSSTNAIWATWNPNATWVDVITGDFNGDGRADYAGRELQTGQWWVALSTGSSFTTTLWTTWNSAVTWANVLVGDFNGDGKA